jgi:hypothetical protein
MICRVAVAVCARELQRKICVGSRTPIKNFLSSLAEEIGPRGFSASQICALQICSLFLTNS